MSKSGVEISRESQEKLKEEVLDLLHKQMFVETELVQQYNEMAKEFKSSVVKRLLHTIQLDSMKHIDICQVAIDVLQGKDVLGEEKKELIAGLQRHIELEKEAFDRLKKISNNVWIRETQGLKELVNKWRKDESDHHKTLKKMAGKTFFRISDWAPMWKSEEYLEKRYIKFERKK